MRRSSDTVGESPTSLKTKRVKGQKTSSGNLVSSSSSPALYRLKPSMLANPDFSMDMANAADPEPRRDSLLDEEDDGFITTRNSRRRSTSEFGMVFSDDGETEYESENDVKSDGSTPDSEWWGGLRSKSEDSDSLLRTPSPAFYAIPPEYKGFGNLSNARRHANEPEKPRTFGARSSTDQVRITDDDDEEHVEGMILEADVVVIGGGLAGITSAMRMAKLGCSVVLCDAWELGGRTKSLLMDNGKDKVSVGGTWANFECDDLLGLANEVGTLPFAPKFRVDGPAFGHMMRHPITLAKLYQLGKRFYDEMSAGIRSPEARALDDVPLQTWLDNLSFFHSAESKQTVLVWLAILENLPWDLSLLSTLYCSILVYSRMSNPTQTGKVVPQILRWEGGTGVLIESLREKLLSFEKDGKKQVTIIEYSPVSLVEYSDNGVTVTLTEDIVHASAAIFAVSPRAVKNIAFDPPLPQKYHTANSAMQGWADPSFNIVLTFQSQFWAPIAKQMNFLPSPVDHPNPHHPTADLQLTDYTLGAIMDLTPSREEGEEGPGYIRIIIDSKRTEGLTEDQVKESALAYLYESYPEIDWGDAADIDMSIVDWREKSPYLEVTYFWTPGSNFLDHFFTLNEPHQCLYWAGAERSLSGLSWMEGAVTSGTAAAYRIAEDWNLEGREEVFIQVEADKRAAVEHIMKADHIGVGVDTIVSMIQKVFKITDNMLSMSFTSPSASPRASPRASPGVSPRSYGNSPRRMSDPQTEPVPRRRSSVSLGGNSGPGSATTTPRRRTISTKLQPSPTPSPNPSPTASSYDLNSSTYMATDYIPITSPGRANRSPTHLGGHSSSSPKSLGTSPKGFVSTSPRCKSAGSSPSQICTKTKHASLPPNKNSPVHKVYARHTLEAHDLIQSEGSLKKEENMDAYMLLMEDESIKKKKMKLWKSTLLTREDIPMINISEISNSPEEYFGNSQSLNL
eukprot:TRINITY_DN14156_c0_g1_i1.p1 TRINITY_DN14156_c0_g1~~TRINITY_DN14156_c0_g1_i1.p1  ORF type:complete len:972 (+),score=219.29 TRINITY_DN14156_c0_g1_i1:27-2918(+)